jgi:cell division protein FtsN
MSQNQDDDGDDGFDEALSFDPRTEGRIGERRFPLVLIFSVLLLLAIIAGIAFAYRGGARHKGEGPTMVGQSLDGMKSAPDPADQPVDPAKGLTIYHESPDASAAVPEYAPAPEDPMPRAEVPAPAPPTAVVPAPVTVPAPVSSAPVSAAPAPVVVAKPPPVQTVAPKPVVSAPAAAKPVVVAPKTEPAVAKPKPVDAVAKPAGSSSSVVQIGAFSSMAQAEAGWDTAAKSAGAAMSGKSRRIEPVEKDGQTLYRTSVVGFSSKADAQALCDKLKSAGKSCFVR